MPQRGKSAFVTDGTRTNPWYPKRCKKNIEDITPTLPSPSEGEGQGEGAKATRGEVL